MFRSKTLALDFAELRNGHFYTKDGDIVDDPSDLSWVTVYGCHGVPTFAFEPCDEEELMYSLMKWREWRCLGDHKIFYGLFRYGKAYRIAPLYEEFSINTIKSFDDVETGEDIFNALSMSEEAEDRGLVGVL
tara:strand:- start:3567 stop:3962 length:396 start_codon:yes stop_codon:yes gene_type:complete